MIQSVKMEPGTYIAAISGGVDSVVLLDVLSEYREIRLVVAHVDHGIRDNSNEDAQLVERLAARYGHPFETISLNLGPRVSEATAREVRHAWLQTLLEKYKATSIVTAHHRDDVIETMLINLLRGTGWRGLSSLRNTDRYHRPLLSHTKAELVHHAIERGLQWNEDSTNDDLRYLRNYVRHGIASKLTGTQADALVKLYTRQCELRDLIKAERGVLQTKTKREKGWSRYWFIMTPDSVAKEFLRHHFGALQQASIRQLLHFVRTARPGAQLTLSRGLVFRVTKSELIVCTSEDC